MGVNERTYTAGRFALDIDGFNVGFLKKFSGLHMEAEIATNDLGPDNRQKKHVSNVKWTPGKATIGIGMGKGMYDWIKAAFDKGYITKSGTFTAADFNYKAKSHLAFRDALITAVTVPTLDGSSKDAAYFDVEFEAEEVRFTKGDGNDIRGKIGPKQKQWLCANFECEVGGLPTKRVAKIDTFTWKCAVATDMVGILVENTKHPAKVTVPDISFHISMADHQEWADAAKKWFIDGARAEENEMTGMIKFLAPNMKDMLGDISLENVGFKSFKEDDREANSEKIARFTATMYTERMTFNLKEFDA